MSKLNQDVENLITFCSEFEGDNNMIILSTLLEILKERTELRRRVAELETTVYLMENSVRKVK